MPPSKRVPRAPEFTRRLPEEMILVAGVDERLVLSVEMDACPAAAFTWTLDGVRIDEALADFKLIAGENASSLVVESAVPPLLRAGVYAVEARNAYGAVSTQTKVI